MVSGSGRGEGSGWIRVRVRLSAGVLPPSTTLTRSGRPTEKRKTHGQRNPLIVDDVDAAAARRPVLRRRAPSPPPSREPRQRGCPRLQKRNTRPVCSSDSGDSTKRMSAPAHRKRNRSATFPLGLRGLSTKRMSAPVHSRRPLLHSQLSRSQPHRLRRRQGRLRWQRPLRGAAPRRKKYLVPKNKDTMARPLRAAKPREETKCRAQKA